MVMVRDISHAVRIADQPRVVTSLVLDVETGLVLGIGAAASTAEACRTAFNTAVTTRTSGVPFDPGPPERVLCAREHLDEIAGELTAVIGVAAAKPEEVVPGPDAEDIVDSFVGHMAGRAQPDNPPTPADWRQLVTLTRDYTAAQPWTRPYLTEADLDLTLTVDGTSARYVPVVLGKDGIQRGLVLYPGAVLPESLFSWRPGQSAAAPAGTLICYLDPPSERTPDALGRATRYGWPDGAPLAPLFVTMTPDERPADISRADARYLTLAMAAVLHADDAWSGRSPSRITGAQSLAGGGRGEYAVSLQPATPDADRLTAVVQEAMRTHDPHELLDLLLGSAGADPFSRARPSQRRPRRDDVVTYRVRVDLKGAKPPVWRRLELSSDLMLDELHRILQASFDWHDAHLHQFGAGPTSFYDRETEHFLSPYDIEEGEDQGVAEADVRLDEVLAKPGDRLFYLYDFGDGWEHVIKLEAVLPRDARTPRAVCTKGRQPSPAENCGGIWTHNLITAATDPSSRHHKEAIDELARIFGPVVDLDTVRPIPFDVDEVNAALTDVLR
jgi:hypothetical protein